MGTLSERLKSTRKEMKLSQKRLGELIGVTQSVIGGLETGYRKNSAYTPQLAQVLGVNALWLATGEGEKYISKSTKEKENTISINIDDPEMLEIVRLTLKQNKEDLPSLRRYLLAEDANAKSPGSKENHRKVSNSSDEQ